MAYHDFLRFLMREVPIDRFRARLRALDGHVVQTHLLYSFSFLFSAFSFCVCIYIYLCLLNMIHCKFFVERVFESQARKRKAVENKWILRRSGDLRNLWLDRSRWILNRRRSATARLIATREISLVPFFNPRFRIAKSRERELSWSRARLTHLKVRNHQFFCRLWFYE